MKRSLNFLLISTFAVLTAYLFTSKAPNQATGSLITKFPGDYNYLQRAYPFDRINFEAQKAGLLQAKAMKEANRSLNTPWVFCGPTNIGGRITDMEMHPSDQQTMYAGTASGGVWKSTDAGSTWFPIFDNAITLSIGDLAIAPSDPNIIYVGTGESNCGGGSLAYDGNGVYKSTDAGQTWTQVGLEDTRNTGNIVIDPTDPNRVFVAAVGDLFGDTPDRGIYRTTDGGTSWQNVLFISDSTGGIDLAIHPTNPDTVYAAMWQRVRHPHRRSYGGSTSGIYRSYDGGTTWTELTTGLPSPSSTNAGRIGIDIAESSPNILYCIYTDSVGYFEGVFKTTNNGDAWSGTNDGALANMYSSFGWWNGKICIDPTDPDKVFVGGLDIYRTTTGGNSWSNVSGGMHVDQHGVYIHPQNSNLVLAGNDGGIYISQNGGSNWNKVNSLGITQFYTGEIDFQNPARLYGGTQDNGTNRTMTGNLNDWNSIHWGDGFYVLVDPTNNQYVYAESQWGDLVRSTNGGSNFIPATFGISGGDRNNWNSPAVFDPSNASTLYFGTHRLYRSTNRAQSWSSISGDLTNGDGGGNVPFGTITTISVSELNPDIIWVGTDDGNVNVTTDGGNNWNNVSSAMPNRWVTRVAADPFDAQTAYATFSGYRWDDFISHIFRTTDGGSNWIDISSNLPEIPINDVIVDPDDGSNLFIATDAGCFATYNSGTSWSVLGDSLPPVVVNDLTLHNPTRTLVAATFGRSQWKIDLGLATGNKEVAQSGAGFKIYPNPFRESTRIGFALDELKYGVLQVFDIRGNLVKTFHKGNFPEGEFSFVWDGRNQHGVRLPSGNYLCRLLANDLVISMPVVISR